MVDVFISRAESIGKHPINIIYGVSWVLIALEPAGDAWIYKRKQGFSGNSFSGECHLDQHVERRDSARRTHSEGARNDSRERLTTIKTSHHLHN